MNMKANGVNSEELVKEEDITENGNFTGYHKRILIQDYVSITQNANKQSNLVKKVTVEISYKLANKKDEIIQLSTYITHL